MGGQGGGLLTSKKPTVIQSIEKVDSNVVTLKQKLNHFSFSE